MGVGPFLPTFLFRALGFVLRYRQVPAVLLQLVFSRNQVLALVRLCNTRIVLPTAPDRHTGEVLPFLFSRKAREVWLLEI